MNRIIRFNKKAASAESKPHEVIELLNIKEGDAILEIGVGGGYYAEIFSDLIGENGTYYGVDIDDVFLMNLEKINRTKGHGNIRAIKSADGNLQGLGERVDLIFTRNTYHHLTHRTEYFRRLGNHLAERGRLAIIDYDEHAFFLSLSKHCTKTQTIIDEMASAHYTLVSNHGILRGQSFLIFDKRS